MSDRSVLPAHYDAPMRVIALLLGNNSVGARNSSMSLVQISSKAQGTFEGDLHQRNARALAKSNKHDSLVHIG